MSDVVPMTRESFARKKAEVERLQNEEMPRIAEKIAAARDEGDLKENAEYHAQREAQGMMQARINRLRGELARASIIDTSKIPQDQVAFGATVTVRDLENDDEEEFTLVGAGDEDLLNDKYPITGPLGQGLLGKKVGEVAEVEAPRRVLRYEVLKIEYTD
jgi:transcription elongation factor GreA